MNDPENPNPWDALQADVAVQTAAPVPVESAVDGRTPYAAESAPVEGGDTAAPDAITDPPHGIPYQWSGRTWRLKPQFDLRVVVALKAGDFSRALGLLMGKAQTEALIGLDSEEPFTDDVLKDMIETVARKNGTSLPE